MPIWRKSRKTINVDKLPDYTIGELLKTNREYVKALVNAYIERLKRKQELLKMQINLFTDKQGKPIDNDTVESLNQKLERNAKKIETLKKIATKIEILDTIPDLEPYFAEDREIWNAILSKVTLKDLLGYEGDPRDKIQVLNYLRSIIKSSTPATPEDKQRAIQKEISITRDKQLTKQPPPPPPQHSRKVLTITFEKNSKISVDRWMQLFKEAIEKSEIIELSIGYLDIKNHGESLRNMFTAMLNLAPEDVRRIVPEKYKYIRVAHQFLYDLIVKKQEVIILPASSEREIIEGEGGVLRLFNATCEEVKTDVESLKKKICRISIGEREYVLEKEVEIVQKRPKQIKYRLVSS